MKKIARKLWRKLGDVPVNSDQQLALSFLHFHIGTPVEEVWHWFEEAFPGFSAGRVMY